MYIEMNDFVNKNGLKLYKTSARTGAGVHDGFMYIAKEEALNYDSDIEEEREEIQIQTEIEIEEEQKSFYDPIIEVLEELAEKFPKFVKMCQKYEVPTGLVFGGVCILISFIILLIYGWSLLCHLITCMFPLKMSTPPKLLF